MFHRVTIIGRVGQDPEMRYTPEGTPVTNFSVATTAQTKREGNCPNGWKESYNGKYWQLTTWWRVTAWRQLAETVNQYVNKGMLIFVEGEIKGEAVDGSQYPRIWKGQDGEAKSSFELTARNVKFLSGGQDEESDPRQSRETGVAAYHEGANGDDPYDF